MTPAAPATASRRNCRRPSMRFFIGASIELAFTTRKDIDVLAL